MKCSLAAAAFALLAACSDDGAPEISINEVMASNATACADQFGEFDDWIELYNATGKAISLENYAIADDAGAASKAVLPADLEVPAKGFLVIWLDQQVQGVDHLPFKLDADGDAVTLYAPDGAELDSFAWTRAQQDKSYARVPDGTGELTMCGTPSCGASNGTGCARTAP